MVGHIFEPVTLPCGQVMRNRLVKVAMYEHLTTFFGGPPNKFHNSLYSEWARHDWGMLVTGNVIVSPMHLTLGRDIIVPEQITDATLRPFRSLASAMHGIRFDSEPSVHGASGPLAIMQLNHAGRQSSNFLGGRYPFQPPLAPSPLRVNSKSKGIISTIFHWILFQRPQPMSLQDVDQLVSAFVKGAKVALESGFDGVQLHVAHGYVLAQFVSPKSNIRKDVYSSKSEDALRLVHRIVTSIRSVVPKSFAVGIKLNAGDYVSSVEPEGRIDLQGTVALEHVLAISQWAIVDFIEISGGDYENPEFMKSVKSSKHSPRKAFFARFSQEVLKAMREIPPSTLSYPLPLILLTGGLRTPELLHNALLSEHTDLLGIGRGSVLCPNLPMILKQKAWEAPVWDDVPFGEEPEFGFPMLLKYWPFSYIWSCFSDINLIGAGIEMAWYVVMIRNLALKGRGKHDGRTGKPLGAIGAVVWMWIWICRPHPFAPIRNWSVFLAALLAFIGILRLVSASYFDVKPLPQA